MINIALFASGNGSNADRIMDHFHNHPEIRVAILLSNNPDAFALQRAQSYGVTGQSFNRKTFYETNEILDLLNDLNISLIALAGFLWLVPSSIVSAYPNKIVNIHPALLPKYGGKGMYGMNVHQAVFDNRESESGITIHLVNNQYDRGTIIHQRRCPIESRDKPEEIAKKVLALEHSDYPKVIENLIRKSGKNS
jgi:phosphoribosylglycinamide formyltransferase-1